MRVLLVNMPWALIDVPSLALGILSTAAAGAVPGEDVEVEVLHANLDFVDWVTERTEFDVGDYHYYSLNSYFAGVGDWVFTSALHDDPDWHVAELAERVPMDPDQRARAEELHRLAPRYVAELAGRIAAREPDLVGFTSTFQQNMAALATARAVKAARPATLTAMGGANCDGAQGEALHRNFDFVDFVVRGEGEVVFPQLLRALHGQGRLAAVPGLCWRPAAGGSRANPMSSRPLAPAQIVAPNYDGYFERLEESRARDWVEPKLVVEGARGCWWGQKHHCTFCGLNGSFMEFRSKGPGAFKDEILGLVERHQVLDMFVVDNILDMGYVGSLLPMLIDAGYDLRMQYEIKSNMKQDQLDTLSAAGLVNVQPGIENLHSTVLKIMDKGVTGCQNVRMLRDASNSGLSVAWNYLYGFPGESDEDYLSVIEQFPALHHLPPLDGVARIVIERFSPYFDRPELGFGELRPAAQYPLNYDLPESELLDLAYLFEVPPRGVGEDVGDALRAAADRWQREFARSRLSHTDLGDEIVLVSRRAAFDWTVLRLTDPTEVAAFRLLELPRAVPWLARRLGRPEPSVAALLDRWVRLGILFTESGHYVHVAPRATNQELVRIDMAEPPAEPAVVAPGVARPADGGPPGSPGAVPAAVPPAAEPVGVPA
jgi:ribosomal peptide maturation radical SAM protein 1